MITEAVIGVFSAVFGWLLAALPTIAVPAWFTGLSTAVGDAATQLGALNVWLPLTAISTVLVALLALQLVLLGIRAGRILLSLFTGGGGSAA